MGRWLALAMFVGAVACLLAHLVLNTAGLVLALRKADEPRRWALARLLLFLGACALILAGARVAGIPLSW